MRTIENIDLTDSAGIMFIDTTLEAAQPAGNAAQNQDRFFSVALSPTTSARYLREQTITVNAILRADMQKTAARLRAPGEQAGATERKQSAANWLLLASGSRHERASLVVSKIASLFGASE